MKKNSMCKFQILPLEDKLFKNRSPFRQQKQQTYYYKDTDIDDFVDLETLSKIKKHLAEINSQINTIGSICDKKYDTSTAEYEAILDKERQEIDAQMANTLKQLEELLLWYKKSKETNYKAIYQRITNKLKKVANDIKLQTAMLMRKENTTNEYKEDEQFLTKELNYAKEMNEYLKYKLNIITTADTSLNEHQQQNENVKEQQQQQTQLHQVQQQQQQQTSPTEVKEINKILKKQKRQQMLEINVLSSDDNKNTSPNHYTTINKSTRSFRQNKNNKILITSVNSVFHKKHYQTNSSSLNNANTSASGAHNTNTNNNEDTSITSLTIEQKVKLAQRHLNLIEKLYKNKNKQIEKKLVALHVDYLTINKYCKNQLHLIFNDIVSDIKQTVMATIADPKEYFQANTNFNLNNYLNKLDKKEIVMNFLENREIKKMIFDALYSQHI